MAGIERKCMLETEKRFLRAVRRKQGVAHLKPERRIVRRQPHRLVKDLDSLLDAS